jgi:hypothetical protein
MQQLVERMTDNIERTARLYEQILATERDKQRAIIESNIDALTEVVAREEELVALATELEAERTTLRRELAEADGRLGALSRLPQLIAILDGPPRERLRERREHLLALAGQINEVNRENFQLLRYSLDMVRGVLDSVFGAAPEPHTYNPSGRQEGGTHAATRVNQVL